MNPLRRLLQQEDLNFLLTNRVPRIALTHLMGWYSHLRLPWLTRASIAVWRCFTDLNLREVVIFVPLILATLILGLQPNLVFNITGPAVDQLVTAFQAARGG